MRALDGATIFWVVFSLFIIVSVIALGITPVPPAHPTLRQICTRMEDFSEPEELADWMSDKPLSWGPAFIACTYHKGTSL